MPVALTITRRTPTRVTYQYTDGRGITAKTVTTEKTLNEWIANGGAMIVRDIAAEDGNPPPFPYARNGESL